MNYERQVVKHRLDDLSRPARVARAFLHALFPTRCLRCRDFFHDSASGKNGIASNEGRLPVSLDAGQRFDFLTAPFLCPDCRSALDPVAEPFCSKCGEVFAGRTGLSHLCSDCMRNPRYYESARAAGLYTGALRAVIHRLKYSGWVHLAYPLGRWMAEQASRYWAPEDFDVILPVPMHSRKLRSRGFNQAYLLMGPLAKWATDGGQKMQTARRVLVRTRETRPQTGMKRVQRVRNVQGVFSVPDSSAVRDKKILLVDDVLTTGATANECARVLRSAGARRVDVMTLARAASQPVSARIP